MPLAASPIAESAGATKKKSAKAGTGKGKTAKGKSAKAGKGKSAKGKAKAAVSIDELPSVEAKNKERDALAKAMEEFLARGGKVQEVEANVVADPPKKPDNKYGSRPI